MPARPDRTAGNTAAICGITGITVLVVFGVAYGFGRVERTAREAELNRKDDLDELEKDAEAARLELEGGGTALADEGEEETIFPPGSAACPVCGTVHLDSDHAADCCDEARGYREEEPEIVVDKESGEVRDNVDPEEPEGVEDLWPDHLGDPDQSWETEAEDNRGEEEEG
jgi:hypothetical protein